MNKQVFEVSGPQQQHNKGLNRQALSKKITGKYVQKIQQADGCGGPLLFYWYFKSALNGLKYTTSKPVLTN